MAAITAVLPNGAGLFQAPVASKTPTEVSQLAACNDPERGGKYVEQHRREKLAAAAAGRKFILGIISELAASHARECPYCCPLLFDRPPAPPRRERAFDIDD